MNYYFHINTKLREQSYSLLLLLQTVSIREMAKQLGRSPSTISRELKRNQINERDSGYIPSRMPRKYIKT